MDQPNQNPSPPLTNASQPEPVATKHYKSFWPIVLIATLSALVGGIIVWAAYNAGLDEELNSLLPGADRRIAREEKSLTLEPMSTSAGIDWKIYKNSDLNFGLQLTDAWKNFKVIRKEMSSNFGSGSFAFLIPTNSKIYSGEYPGYAQIMVVYAFNSEYWAKLSKEEGSKPVYLGKNQDGTVFAYSAWQDAPEDLIGINFELQKVADSFKFIP